MFQSIAINLSALVLHAFLGPLFWWTNPSNSHIFKSLSFCVQTSLPCFAKPTKIKHIFLKFKINLFECVQAQDRCQGHFKMGKNDENKENHNEFCQPLLPEDKSDYLISSSSSSATSHLSDLVAAEVAAAAALRNFQQHQTSSTTSSHQSENTAKFCSTDVCNSGVDQRRFPTVQPGCALSLVSQEPFLLTNNRNQKSTKTSLPSPVISIDRKSPIIQIDSGNECNVGSSTVESSTDSQQALFASEAKSTHFYKRWFFNRSRQLPTSSAKTAALLKTNATYINSINTDSQNTTQSTSSITTNSSHLTTCYHSAANPSSSGTRKRRMINLSQYNSYMKEEKNGVRTNHSKHKKAQGKKCNTSFTTSVACRCNGSRLVDLPFSLGNQQEDDQSLPNIVLPGPSGLQSASPNCCLSESSDSLSQSSSSENFTFDSDDDGIEEEENQFQVQVDNSSDDGSQKRRRQPSASGTSDTVEILLSTVHRPLMMADSPQHNGYKITSDSKNQQLLNAQALYSAPVAAGDGGPTEEQLTVSSGDSRCKKSILLPQLHQDCKRKPNSSSTGKGNTNHHLQLNSTTLGGSMSQLSVASSLFTDPLLPICKICHLNGKEGDPLISPCKCAGTMQFIHCGCLMVRLSSF